jgi:hypothetical protein
MCVPGAQPGAADADGALVQVYVVPGEPQCLALAQAECQRQRPPGAVAPLGGGFEQPLDLGYVVRLDLFLIELRCLGHQNGVAGQVRPPDRLIQCGAERPVDVVNAAR